MPLYGASGLPLKSGCWPARQPSAAITVPPLWSSLSAGCTATSVTTFAKKQSGFDESPVHGPVGRLTLSKLRPASVERNRPNPVATYMTLGRVGWTATRKESAPSGTPLDFVQVPPPSVV